MPKVALIGLGTMGQLHAEAWSRMPGVQFIGISGQHAEKTQRLAARFGVQAYYGLDQLLAEADFDVLDICVPSYLHHAFVLKAANAGKHVVCEKPLALHAREAEELVETCKARGVRLFVGHDLRFCPEYERAHRLVKSGKLGRTAVVRMSRTTAYPQGWDNWFADEARSGGLLMDLLIHDFDWLRWTFGEVKRVTARRASRDSEAGPLEYVLVTLRMEDGTIALVEGSWAHTEFNSSFEITGTGGMIVENMANNAPLLLRQRSGLQQSEGGVIVPELIANKSPLQKELEHFVRCLETGSESLITAYDGFKAVEIAEAAIASARTGESVTLSRTASKEVTP
ncbi:Gfo/Idh/MocA family oxidoreductase [Paenibacillus rhizovicinus]|uniref:Gfo/Idh/MocA family oxidoreductase n=1 Tax=Paenibacillus rhizovicinus TaxID=2704463 RepID=A0A6C0P5V8_9BACL|nr:Gfo/Idh/MocA family oxidoreductase [Paenibacillus rhizovicinus]QHW33696.1 Gfo/Idh/MocA family oxidoreductase [Paenibacillus rhizovicinus]